MGSAVDQDEYTVEQPKQDEFTVEMPKTAQPQKPSVNEALQTFQKLRLPAPQDSKDIGFWHSVARGFGIPTNAEEALPAMQAILPKSTKPADLVESAKNVMFPVEGAAKSWGHSILEHGKSGYKDIAEASENVKKGQPYFPNVGKSLYGLTDMLSGITSPIGGESLFEGGHQIAQGNIKGGLGSTVPAIATAVMPEAARRVGAIAGGDANTSAVYRKYLNPIADQPHPLPEMTPKVFERLAGEVETTDPAMAQRMREGKTTLGDADTIRQIANRFGKAAYKHGSDIPPEMAQGTAQAASDIRESLYPAIEKAHGLPEGSMQKLKLLQGDLLKIKSGKTVPQKIGSHVGGALGAGTGAAIGGHVPLPGVETGGAITGYLAGRPLGKAIAAAGERGIVGLKTKMLSSGLPEPRPYRPVEGQGIPRYTQEPLIPTEPKAVQRPMATVVGSGPEAASSEELFGRGGQAQHIVVDRNGNIKQYMGVKPDTGSVRGTAQGQAVIRRLRSGKYEVVSNNTPHSEEQIIQKAKPNIEREIIAPRTAKKK